MWKTYGNGVAIFSRFELLKSQLAPMLDNILVGMVRYGEKDITGYNLIRFLYTKQHHFQKVTRASRGPFVLRPGGRHQSALQLK